MIQYTEESLGIYAVPLYRPRACKELVESVRADDCWGPAQVRTWQWDGGYQTEVVYEARAASILWPARGEEIYRGFHAKLDCLIKPLVKHLWRANYNEHADTQLVRYSSGGYYHTHTDNSHDLGARFFTVLCYLNDDFEGGGTYFPSLGHTVTPEAGKAIFFPSKYFHRAEPVSGGEKYVLVSWLLGPPPIRWI
ncbi:MAG TPA: 2OG-Fe(II) oxygenase [Pyrinomonadaceae bacterium]|jgi:hypothetical protein